MDTKPGWLTTEFWVALVTVATGVASIVEGIRHGVFDKSSLDAIIPSVGMLAAALASMAYSHSRAKVKAAASSDTATTVGSINVSGDSGFTAVELCVLVVAVIAVLWAIGVVPR